jgi:hypothetical protein
MAEFSEGATLNYVKLLNEAKKMEDKQMYTYLL